MDRGVIVDGAETGRLKFGDTVIPGLLFCGTLLVACHYLGEGVRIGKDSAMDAYSYIGAWRWRVDWRVCGDHGRAC